MESAVGGLVKLDDAVAQKIASIGSGIVTGRKHLSDISNTGNVRESLGMSPPKPSAAINEYVSQLLKENTALLRLLGERNKIIEESSVELQKLRFTLQKINQQNWQLAQSNSHMLAELNSGKDRLKAMQHELGCMAAVLRAKTSELEEKNKMNKRLYEKVKCELHFKDGNNKPAEATTDVQRPASPKRVSNSNRKRAVRNQSLGSVTVSNSMLLKEKDEIRRTSPRRRSSSFKSTLCEPKQDLFEIEDVKLSIGSSANDRMTDDIPNQPEPTAACSSSNDLLEPAKDEAGLKEVGIHPQSQNQVSRRSSIGRPLRKAVEKVNSYKEVPLNVKIRRKE